ncbi:hypothetical protein DFR86_04740 [Acidianus sulfidivorans JP7]|uniref:Uncharacterized protein n=1 Tax=Acidianus sulfidivorans JP7 TaxID=619593 RepID=A0A2U9ILQ0_9CREN|nr:hypothetical protein [Acidianus sulfidivorans]AWR96933.1 hypothetical protein DFR86_04740 [Acidianus sulfidivorans JP7]
MNKRKITIFLISAIAIIGILVLTYPTISSLVSPSSGYSIYEASYGNFPVEISTTSGIKTENITGIMIIINNIDESNLAITCIQNSSTTIPVSSFYEKISVVSNNGNIISAFILTREVYIGEQTILIPIKLSPGNYTVILSDGNFFTINVK